MKKPLLFLSRMAAVALFVNAASQGTQAQSVGIGTTTPDSKAALDIQTVASNKGMLIPRLSSTQRRAILNPPQGLLVFQTGTAATAADSVGFWYATGTVNGSGVGRWLYLPDKATAGDNLGNHTATQNLNLGANKLVGQTSSTDAVGTLGLGLSSDGLATLGTANASSPTNGAGLHLFNADAGLLATGRLTTGTIPATGSGIRLMWYPYKASFRAGNVNSSQWDDGNTGFYSAAFGEDNTASGNYSFAVGTTNTASGGVSFAAGVLNRASGITSFVLGRQSTADADNSIALGFRASTNGWYGSMVLGGMSNSSSRTATLNSSAAGQLSAVYPGGYRLFSDNAMSIGATLAAGANAWTTLSDSTRKERVRLADGNELLRRVGLMRLGSWNYKGQSADTMRHYGPMAQDFFAAFGHDGVGRVGHAKGINQADFDGVNLILIQALYRRVQALEADNAALRAQAPAPAPTVEARLRALEARLAAEPGGPLPVAQAPR